MLFVLFSIDLDTCKSDDFDGWYSRTHAKEKPSKISNTTFAILLPYQKNKKHKKYLRKLKIFKKNPKI